MTRVLFIDRDGTLVEEPPIDKQLDSFSKLKFLPHVITQLATLANETEFVFVMVTNQDGLGTSSFPEETFWPIQNFIVETLASEGIVFEDVYIDDSFEHEQKPTRKPGTAMLQKYIYGPYDLANSFVIGDRATDVLLAKNLGCKSIYMGDEMLIEADYKTQDWRAITSFLKQDQRYASTYRKTKETEITASINLHGSGKNNIKTGLHFFDHMLQQIAVHGCVDLAIEVKGDLEVDEHHTIEDTAIVLGDVVAKALGNKKGIERYGFLLPMDDSLAQVAIDFGGRSWCVWDVTFSREKIGDVPSEMFYHFFKSFCDSAKCNLNVQCKADNEHHKIESIFKAFARAIKMAVANSNQFVVPSSKGSL